MTYATQSAFSADVMPGAGKSASANVDIGSIGNHEVRCWLLISVLSAIKWSFSPKCDASSCSFISFSALAKNVRSTGRFRIGIGIVIGIVIGIRGSFCQIYQIKLGVL